MEKIRTFQQYELNKIRKNVKDSGLQFEKFGRSSNIMDYSDREINEMILGIYKDSKHLLVDGDYFIDVSTVQKASCILTDISYSRRIKPDKTSPIKLKDIRNFYIEDYFVETSEKFSNSYQHRITGYLKKIGGISLGKGKYSHFYSIPNDFKTFYKGIPLDLFYPIQHYINSLFFADDYHVATFEVVGNLTIIDE
ncbi:MULTISPECIES: hypothetical protein [Sphingobacterium]|uniref:Uncharacterized protein n=1 Tax=Sphingobacterium athyrii TaxID=2152717 RepID=A0A363NU75_9SPHI|nr:MULTISPECIES: hypothetical protein [Sphingobacterium]PUV24317.1 hypothetical protein DCO56_13275 [Sphingobacterium athyrii]QIH33945.1 hypothetical protein G6053_14090 [Sphingobacterium sp. DR205]